MNFESLSRNYLELEEVNGLPRTAMPELPVPRMASVAEAEQLAATVRAHLDLGPDAPIRDLRVRLEDTFALRVVLNSRSGASPPPRSTTRHRRLRDGSRALGAQHARHAGARAGPPAGQPRRGDGGRAGGAARPPAENFATAFAAALLLPARGPQRALRLRARGGGAR
jgi:hypothetical protein